MATKSALNSWKNLGFTMTELQTEAKWKFVKGSNMKPTKAMIAIVESATVRECKFEDEEPVLKVHIILNGDNDKRFSLWFPLDLKAIKARKLEPGMECDITTFNLYELSDGSTTIKRCDIKPL